MSAIEDFMLGDKRVVVCSSVRVVVGGGPAELAAGKRKKKEKARTFSLPR